LGELGGGVRHALFGRMALINIDRTFVQSRVAELKHRLSRHPLMSTEKLCELALRLPKDRVRYHEGERAFENYWGAMFELDKSRSGLERAIDNLPHGKAFVQLNGVRADPQYRELVDDFLDEIVPCLAPDDRSLINRDASAFLASPHSVTPFHLDHDQNFLCHIRGPKRLWVWDPDDRVVVSARSLEHFFKVGTGKDIGYREEFAARAHVFELQPGDSVFMPMGAPHAVKTGSGVAVTFSMLMNTPSSMMEADIWRANYRLRQLGLDPLPVGASHLRDSLKAKVLRAIRGVRDLVSGHHTAHASPWY
jgi:hypothetical protein